MRGRCPSRDQLLAWGILAVLFLASIVNYLDRAALGVVKPRLQGDLGISNADYGVVVNVFLLAYMVFYTGGGRLADLFGARRVFPVCISLWSLASMLHAAAVGVVTLSAARGFLGLAEGAFYPTAMRAVSDWFPERSRAKAWGLLLCGLSVGALLSPPLIAWLSLRYNWRVAFLVSGAIGFLLVPPWLILFGRARSIFGTPDPAPARCVVANGSEAGGPLHRAVLRRNYLCLLLARGMTDAVWYFYLFWIPGYFQDVRGFGLDLVGRWLWLPYFCADLGALGGGWMSSHLIARGVGVARSRTIVLLLSALICASGAAVPAASSPSLALVLVSLALFGHQAWSTNLHTAIGESVPPQHVAAAYGLTGSVGSLMGGVAQFLIGRTVDVAGYGPVFTTCALAYGFALTLVLAGKIRSARAS